MSQSCLNWSAAKPEHVFPFLLSGQFQIAFHHVLQRLISLNTVILFSTVCVTIKHVVSLTEDFS